MSLCTGDSSRGKGVPSSASEHCGPLPTLAPRCQSPLLHIPVLPALLALHCLQAIRVSHTHSRQNDSHPFSRSSAAVGVHCGAHGGCIREHEGDTSHRERGEVPQSYNESRGKALQVGGLHGQRVRSQKMQSKFRGSEGALVPTNTVVLEVVRDEVGWVGWLYSAGVGVKQGVVGTLFSSRCSGCLWWVPLGCGVFIEEARSRASRGLSPLSSRPASPTGQVSARLCSGRMEIPEPIPGLPGGDGVGGAKGQWPVETRCKVIPQFGHQVAPVSSAWAKLSRAEEQRGLRHPVRQPFSPWLQVDLPGSFKSNPCLSSIPRESDLVNLLEARAWVFS